MLKNVTIFDSEDKDEDNTDNEMNQGSSAKGGKMKRTASLKNLMSRSDDNDVVSPKQKWTGTKRGKPRRPLVIRSQQLLTHYSAASPLKPRLYKRQ